MKLYIEISLGNEAMQSQVNVVDAITRSFAAAAMETGGGTFWPPLQAADEGLVSDTNGNVVGRWDVLVSDSETELSPTEREAEHARGWDVGYSCAIHDARIPGSRANAELYGDKDELTAADELVLANRRIQDLQKLIELAHNANVTKLEELARIATRKETNATDGSGLYYTGQRDGFRRAVDVLNSKG